MEPTNTGIGIGTYMYNNYILYTRSIEYYKNGNYYYKVEGEREAQERGRERGGGRERRRERGREGEVHAYTMIIHCSSCV